jgi:hypothetical protein
VRDNSAAGAPDAGVIPKVRVLVSTLTTGDPVGVALAFAPTGAVPRNDPWHYEQFDWSATLATLAVEVTAPDGKKHTLALAEPPKTPQKQGISDFMEVLSISGSSLGKSPWKSTVPELLAKPGKYSVALSGRVETDKRKLGFAIAPFEVEVVAADAKHKTLSELEAIAAASAAKRFAATSPPAPSAPTVDDVDGNRWFRFVLSDRSDGYHDEVLEILLDPAGRELHLDSYKHFTCVAQGTRIATAQGERAVEELHVGDEIVSYDVALGTLRTSRVQRIDRAHAEKIFEIGPLRVTGEHPVFVGGRFVPARDVPAGARVLVPDLAMTEVTPRSSARAQTVFDLSVSAPHNYFADGVLVHNKAAHVPIGGDAPFRGHFFRRAAKAKP